MRVLWKAIPLTLLLLGSTLLVERLWEWRTSQWASLAQMDQTTRITPPLRVFRGENEGPSSKGEEYDDMIGRLHTESRLESIQRKMLAVAQALERKREESRRGDDSEEKNGGDAADEQHTIMDMASQAERINSWARVAEQEVNAAHIIVDLKKRMVDAAEDRVEAERRRNRRAEQVVEQLDGQLTQMVRRIEEATRQSREKSLESEMRAAAGSKLLAAAKGDFHESVQHQQKAQTSLKSPAAVTRKETLKHADIGRMGKLARARAIRLQENEDLYQREENLIRRRNLAKVTAPERRKIAQLRAAEERGRDLLTSDSALLASDVHHRNALVTAGYSAR